MTLLADIRRLSDHAEWADGLVLAALRGPAGANAEALKEFGHVLGTAENWLARIQQRPPRAPIWPALDFPGLERLAADVHRATREYLDALDEAALDRSVRYTNSAGRTFDNLVKDILLHLALHGQYHRGKVNLLLRLAGNQPAPCDYIAYVRGAPAARSR